MELVCCDLDGTLTPVNTVAVSVLVALRQYPQLIPNIALLAIFKQAKMKQLLAHTVAIDPSGLPYHQPVLDYLHAERARGKHIVLATAADWTVGSRVADYLGVFDDVIASDGQTNRRGRAKRRGIENRYPGTPFTYLGNAFIDRPVWRAAATRIIVTATGKIPWWARDLHFDRIIATQS